MAKYVCFDQNGVAVECLDLAEGPEILGLAQDRVFYKVADDYDFEQNRCRFVVKHGVLTELSVREALEFQRDLAFALRRQEILAAIKREGSRRIQTLKGKYYDDIAWLRKSQNMQDAKSAYSLQLLNRSTPTDDQKRDYDFACEMLERKDRFVARINELEAKVAAMTEKELNRFSPEAEDNWQSLDSGESLEKSPTL